QRLLKLGPFTLLGARFQVFKSGQRSEFLGNGCSNKLVERYIVFSGELSQPMVQRIRHANTDGTHGFTPSSDRKSAGRTALMLNRSIPVKSLMLYVTILLLRDATASSRTRSSFGSRRNGRQRK